MSDDFTARLNLPYLAAAQAQKHVTLNEALSALDGLVQTAAESRTVAAQPPAPAEGALHILPNDRSGPEWSLHPPGALVRFEAGGWERLTAAAGALVFVKDEGRFAVRAAEGWTELGAVLDAPSLRAPAQVSANAGALPAPLPDTLLQLGGADGAQARMVFDAFGSTGNFIFRHAQGAAAAPQPSKAGDFLGQFSAFGRGSSAYSPGARAQVRFLAAEDWTDAAQGAAIVFAVCPRGGGAIADAVKIAANGALQLVGRASPPVDAEAGQIYWDTTLARFRGYDGSAWTDL